MNAVSTMDTESAALAAVYRRLYLKGKRAEQRAREAQEERMRVATKFSNLENLEFAPSALYALAAPSTPESAVTEALEAAQEQTQEREQGNE